MEHYLESIVIVGKTSQLPTPSKVIDQQCELFKSGRVTGILLCGNGHFMTVLEGQPLVLQSVIKQNIKQADQLHIVHKSSIAERNYRHWNIHITDKESRSEEDYASVHKALKNNYFFEEKASSLKTIKNIVAYYYCEYIGMGFNCDDYRLANIA